MMSKASPHEIRDLFGHQIRHLTALSDADCDFCLMRSDFPDGAVVPIHSHADRETFYVLTGRVQALWEDHWDTLVAGDVLDVPSGLEHALRNLSGAPASLLLATTMRMGRFLRDISRPAGAAAGGAPHPEERERFLKIARDYGYWLGSPADNAAVGISIS
jgi:quercetin dioxygenase-like cupin family protein